MGKKVNPLILRISNIKNPAINWNSRWFAKEGNYASYLQEDEKIRKVVKKNIVNVGLDKIVIQRSGKGDLEVILSVSKPGVIIGRGGERSERLKKEIQKIINKNYKLRLTIQEIAKPNLSAEVLSQEAKRMIEHRMRFRRVMKKIVDLAKRAGAIGIKISMAGRLNGVEIARTEKLSAGQMPLQNLRANLDYARCGAHTKWGQVGIKVWVYKGEVFEEK
jgi:small subunit ribosomal protein S3